MQLTTHCALHPKTQFCSFLLYLVLLVGILLLVNFDEEHLLLINDTLVVEDINFKISMFSCNGKDLI